MPRNGFPLRIHALSGSQSPRDLILRAQSPKSPTPGSTTASAASRRAGVLTSSTSAPSCCRALVTLRIFPLP